MVAWGTSSRPPAAPAAAIPASSGPRPTRRNSSGSLHASTVIKVGFSDGMDRDAAVVLACKSLWEAADADSATGGPDVLRGIYPVVATITAEGWQRLADEELATRYQAIAQQSTEGRSR